jgi:hypothetical protein
VFAVGSGGPLVGATADGGERIEGDVIVASTDFALTDRLPIGKHRGDASRVVLSIGQGALRGPTAGSRLEATAKLQFDVCIARSSTATRDCLGDVYGYDPHIEAYLLLASSAAATRPAQGERMGRAVDITCRQDRRASNHHCVISLPWDGAELIGNGEPCRLGSCRINVVVSAWHPNAGSDDFVAFGGVTPDGGRVRNKSTLTAGRSLRGRSLRFGRPRSDNREDVARLPLSKPGKPVREHVIYSVHVGRIERFESVVVDGRFASSIRGLGSAVRTRTQLIIAGSATSTRPATGLKGIGRQFLTDSTNFNCTRRRSAHQTPCRLGEAAAVEVRSHSRRGFFVNLVAGHGALDRRAAGRTARVLDGRLKVWRYKP